MLNLPQCNCQTNLDLDSINLECPRTWGLLQSGLTRGVFQLETPLGRHWTKKCQPASINDLSDVIAMLRPGVMESKVGKRNLPEIYVARKIDGEPVEYLHPGLEPILKTTQGVMLYQEEMMEIARCLAGFNLEESDALRKACGKKLPEEMAKVKTLFISKAKEFGVLSDDEAATIFDWIQKGQRYSFNKCVSGTTVLRRQSLTNKHKSPYLSVEEMFKVRNNIDYAKSIGKHSLYKKWKSLGYYGQALSMCEDGRIRPNIIRNILFSGQQEVFRITLANESVIEVTANHKFPTPYGIKLTNELNVGSLLYVCGPYQTKTTTKRIVGWSHMTKAEVAKYRKDKVVYDHQKEWFLLGQNNSRYITGGYTEWKNNKAKLPNFCQHCGKNGRVEAHHKDRNRTNNKLENLINLCSSCHKKEEYKNGRLKTGQKGYPRLCCEIVKIESIGYENVYDVEMDGPNHNFVTDQNIVTCNSHSVSYAMLGYWSAYCKAHFPVQFFHSWLNFAKWKMDPAAETKDLVQDAKSFDVRVLPPKFMDFQKDTYIDGDCVRFGLLSVKKVGETQLLKLITEKSNLPPEWGEITSWPWLKFLVLFSDKIRIDAFKNLINVGAFDQFGMSRKELQFQVEQWVGLTEKEKSWVSATVISGRLTDLKSALLACARPKKEGGGAANINRIARLKDLVVLLENPPINLADDPYSVAAQEQALLGVSLSYDELDLCKKPENTWTCSKLQKKKPADRFYMTGKLTEIKEYVIKNGNSKGKTMFFIKLADKTGEADNIVAFPYIAEKFCAELVEGNTILIGATYNPDRDSVVIDKVWNL